MEIEIFEWCGKRAGFLRLYLPQAQRCSIMLDTTLLTRFIHVVTVATFVALSLGPLSSSASTSREDIGLILILKRTCDLSVLGFKEKSAVAYAKWRQSNIDVIREIEREENVQIPLDEKRALTAQEQAEGESFCNGDLMEALHVEALHAPDPRLSAPEKTWSTFLSALRNGDRKLALSCLTSTARDKFKPILETIPVQNLSAMASSMKSIQITMGFGSFREATVVRHDGKGGLVYFQDVRGEWKIAEM